jgi:DNA gyrase subunit A
LVKAYSDFAPLVDIHYFLEDADLVLNRYNEPDEIRMVLCNTSLISEKTTKSTKGIQIVRMKKGSIMNMAVNAAEVELNNIEQYRVDKVPMSGTPIDIMDRLLIQQYLK